MAFNEKLLINQVHSALWEIGEQFSNPDSNVLAGVVSIEGIGAFKVVITAQPMKGVIVELFYNLFAEEYDPEILRANIRKTNDTLQREQIAERWLKFGVTEKSPHVVVVAIHEVSTDDDLGTEKFQARWIAMLELMAKHWPLKK